MPGASKSQTLFLAAGEIAHARILFFFELHPRDLDHLFHVVHANHVSPADDSRRNRSRRSH